MRDFGDDVFEGTAKYYARYRPPYPKQLFADVAVKFGLNGEGRLLDIGCGTGEMVIPLAKYFEKALALDPDNEMLVQGRKKAKNLNIGNIIWKKGSSKDLTDVKGLFRLITMGQSFHWMDQETVLDNLYGMVGKNCGVVIVGTEPVEQDAKATQKDQLVKELAAKYLGPNRRAGNKLYTHPEKKYAELLAISKFKKYEEKYYDIKIKRTPQQIIGNLFSMSWASKKLLGEQASSFEYELRQKLHSISGSKKFVERVRFTMCLLSK
jgi:ubiquinone/menaquinone biosynthesis C-methylase UbiE